MLNSGHYVLSDQNKYATKIIKSVIDEESTIFNKGRNR